MGEFLQALTDVYLHRHHPRRVALLAYGEDGRACVRALGALGEALVNGEVRGPDVGPMLWVNGEEWTDLLEGTRGTVEPGARARIDAEFALMGRVMPVGRREDLAAAMQGEPTAVAEHLPAAEARVLDMDAAALRAEVGWLGARLNQFRRSREYLSDGDAARVLAVLHDSCARDAAVFSMSREDAPVLSEFWQDLVRRTPSEVRDSPATMLALSSFLEGKGAQAWTALDQLSESDPLADLVVQALEQAVDPREWDRAVPAAPHQVAKTLGRSVLANHQGPSGVARFPSTGRSATSAEASNTAAVLLTSSSPGAAALPSRTASSTPWPVSAPPSTATSAIARPRRASRSSSMAASAARTAVAGPSKSTTTSPAAVCRRRPPSSTRA